MDRLTLTFLRLTETMFFPVNLHTWDRWTRVVLGIVMIVAGWGSEAGIPAFTLRLFALYPLVTGLVGWCPLYVLLRIRTKK